MDVGFIGLGAMGKVMAQRLGAAGHKMTVYNRSPEKAAPLAAEGMRVAASLDELGGCEVVLSMLADDGAVRGTLLAPGGGLRVPQGEGGIHVSMSTISPALGGELASAHEMAGRHLVCAPVLGRPDRAALGKLTVMAAGEAAAVERVRPLLERIGENVFNLGSDPAAANTAKLGINFLVVAAIEALSESFAFARKGGVDPDKYLEIITKTIFDCALYNVYTPFVAREGAEEAGFTMRLGLKDVKLMLDTAERTAAPLPLASLIQSQMVSALARGYGELDWSTLSRLAARNAGLEESAAGGGQS